METFIAEMMFEFVRHGIHRDRKKNMNKGKDKNKKVDENAINIKAQNEQQYLDIRDKIKLAFEKHFVKKMVHKDHIAQVYSKLKKDHSHHTVESFKNFKN